MKVKRLKEILNNLDDDLEIFIRNSNNLCGNISELEQVEKTYYGFFGKDISCLILNTPFSKELETTEDLEETLPTTVFVEVKGAVNAPGVYELPGDARIKNVLDIAAVSKNADLLTVNQSLKLKDEMVIYVPFKGELDSKEIPYLTTGDSTNLEGSEESSKVNINTADVSELTTLNGIGEKKAQAIIEYREEFGLFSKVEDLMNISGIGEKTFENLQADITIN